MRHFEYLGPDRVIALAYAPAHLRQDFKALLLFDSALGNAVRAAREPMLAQIRLAWWRDQIAPALAGDSAPDPVSRALRSLIHRHDVIQAYLVKMVNGWETLLGDWPLAEDTLHSYAIGRGESLFAAAAECAGIEIDDAIRTSGKGWAIADLACHSNDREMAEAARVHVEAKTLRLPKALRPFTILAGFSRSDARRAPAERIRPGSPKRLTQAIGIVYFRR